MATVIELMQLAYKDINVLGVDETMSADMASDALATLNQMLAQWQTEKLYVYAQKVVSFNATGAQTYTIGIGGTIPVDLPARIDSAVWRLNGVDQPLLVVDSLEEYERIGVKELAGTPSALFYQRSYPLGNVYVWPQPSTGSIRMVTRAQLPTYGSLTDDMLLPNEYALAIRFSLAELMGLSFGLPPSTAIIQRAANARRVMKRNNSSVLPLSMPYGVPSGYRYDIQADQ